MNHSYPLYVYQLHMLIPLIQQSDRFMLQLLLSIHINSLYPNQKLIVSNIDVAQSGKKPQIFFEIPDSNYL